MRGNLERREGPAWNRELLLLEQGILNNRTGNVFAQSGNRRRSTPIALASGSRRVIAANSQPRQDGA